MRIDPELDRDLRPVHKLALKAGEPDLVGLGLEDLVGGAGLEEGSATWAARCFPYGLADGGDGLVGDGPLVPPDSIGRLNRVSILASNRLNSIGLVS